MGTTIKADRRLDTSYEYIQVFRSKGNASTCGWGVRERDSETDEAKSYICTAHIPTAGAAGIRYVRFMTNTISDGTKDVNISVFYLDQDATSIVLLDTQAIPAPAGNWQADTEYFFELDTIYLQPVVNRRYVICFDSTGVTLQMDTTDSEELYEYTGDASGETSILLSNLTATAECLSFECFGEPTAWVQQTDGGAIDAVNEDWFGTETGDFTDMDHIEIDDGEVATAGGEGTYIAVDLADGQAPTGTISTTG
jgi:hypothetical protein